MLMFGIIQNLQTSPIPQTSFLTGTFFATSYSKAALAPKLRYFVVLKRSLCCHGWTELHFYDHFLKPFKSLILKQSYRTFALCFWQTFESHNGIKFHMKLNLGFYAPTFSRNVHQFNHSNVTKIANLVKTYFSVKLNATSKILWSLLCSAVSWHFTGKIEKNAVLSTSDNQTRYSWLSQIAVINYKQT